MGNCCPVLLLLPLLWLCLLLAPVPSVIGAIINAVSVSQGDVTNAILSAIDGDVVLIPAGTATWPVNYSTSKAIILRGAGIGQTIIKDGLTSDNGGPFSYSTSSNKFYRLTGIEFQNGTRTNSFLKGCVIINGHSKAVRVDHCKWDGVRNRYFRIGGAVCGVYDNNISLSSTSEQHILISHDEWEAKTFGDGGWAVPLTLGTTNAFYFQESVFRSSMTSTPDMSDADSAARWVFRNCIVTNMNIASHGTGSTGRNRGQRQWEFYGSLFVSDVYSTKNVIHMRGGTGCVFNNDTRQFDKFLTLHTYRLYSIFNSWGGSTGTNLWDINDGTTVFASGTAGAGSGNLTLVVPGAGWTVNQWLGYTVNANTTDLDAYPDGYFHSVASANTSDTITVKSGAGINGPTKPFVSGQLWEIRRVIGSLDGVGQSTSDLLTNQASVPPPMNLNQTQQAAYSWSNYFSGTLSQGAPNTGLASADPSIWENTNFFNNTVMPGYTPLGAHPLVKTNAIAPTSATVAALATVDFDMSGGSQAVLLFRLLINNSGASINASTGLYTAGSTTGVVDTVQVWDTWGEPAQALVTVGEAPGAHTIRRNRTLRIP